MLQETVVIEGEASLISQIDGDPSLLSEVDGDPDVVIAEGGGIVPSGTIEITENGTYNVTEYASADVDVQGGITPTGTKQISITANGTTTEDVTNYASAEITTNVPASAVDTGTKSISSNGTHDVVGYASASVNVPNSYSASDEGKVVSNGALVAQTSDTVTENGTVDTTLINSLTVNVSGGGGLAYDTGSFTLESDTTASGTDANFAISHNLGKVPKVVIVYTDDYDSQHPNTAASSVGGYVMVVDMFNDLGQRLTSSTSASWNIYIPTVLTSANAVNTSPSTSAAYFPTTRKPTSSEFYLTYNGGSTYWRAGVTYKYIVMEAWS